MFSNDETPLLARNSGASVGSASVWSLDKPNSSLSGRKRKYTSSWFDITIEALGQWRGILVACGVSASHLTGKHTACPACGGKDRFRFDDKNGRGTYICNQCGAGDGFVLLQRVNGWDFQQAARAVEDYIQPGGYTHTQRQDQRPDDHTWRRNLLKKTWEESQPLEYGNTAFRYLVNRGFRLKACPADLRCHPSLAYIHTDKTETVHPSMLALVRGPDGKGVSIHRTYLDKYGRKASVPSPKKLMPPIEPGATKGAAVKLFPPGEILTLAEGIETALAVHLSTGLPSWACVSAGGLEAVILPEYVKRVIIAADNDENDRGQEAARKLAHRLLAEGRKVQIALPESAGMDWADMFIREVANV